jgi:hypothetical protein
MKIILAIFAIAFGAVLFALRDDSPLATVVGGDLAAAITASTNVASPDPNPTPALAAANSGATEIADGGAEGLLRVASDRIDRYNSISAAVRHRIQLFRSELIGSGLYQQAGQGSERRFRLELRTQVGQQVASRLQVCDGDFLWTYREASEKAELERLDLRRVRLAQRQALQLPPQSPVQELAVGGLPKLLEGLLVSFQTLGAEAGYLGEAPMWAIELEWKPSVIAALVPDQRERMTSGESCDFAELPQLPERVMVFLGHENLFPQRIEFRRRASDDVERDEAGEGGGFVPVVTLEFTDVQLNQPIDPRQFQYGPAPATDTTDAFLQSRGLPIVR